jgi:Asp-tRNA(Asn)/Glu-tRNA(Gln) amidotransferase A subunit family amidase
MSPKSHCSRDLAGEDLAGEDLALADGAPVGLSIIGAHGADLDLLRVAVAFEEQAAEKA